MKVSRTISKKEALVLTPNDVRALFTLLSEFSEMGTIDISCADKINRTPANVDELLVYENSPSKEIMELRFRGNHSDRTKSVRLKIANNQWESFNLDVEGPEDNVINLTEKIQEKLTGMIPWYRFAARTNFLVWGIAITLFLAVTVRILMDFMLDSPASGTIHSKTWQDALYNLLMIGIIMFLFAIPTFFGLILNKIQSKIFPMVTFAIGQGEKRYKNREIIQTVIVFGFIVSFITTIISSWFLKFG